MNLFVVLLLLLSGPAAWAQQAELTALLKKENVPGMQLSYTKGKATKTYNLGLRQAGTTQVVAATSIFQAASLGKVVLAYVALRLHDRGVLDLDKSLLAYAPYPRLQPDPRAARITARRVLTHTTGLPNWADNPLGPIWSTSALRLKYAPDSCWNYSGEGYVWLQKTMEHLTGKSWEVLAQEEVFRPLGLKNSSFVWQARFADVAATGHDDKGKPTEVRKFAAPYGAYSLLTTATDYGLFLQALVAGRGLKPATARLLTTPANAADRCGTPASAADPAIAWACGLGLATTSQGPALWHWGDNGDFRGFFMALPGRQESLVFLTNSANGNKLTDEVLRLFFGPGQYWTTAWLAAE
ncbi:serine hydrolase [Hymenobacter sp. BT559]|uniref:serine hydrolase domain-containing protein n=1 Tax=Hymenobacter sp. BT559 TaxID=2795729 RepID=UPI0018ED0B9E|nr:serine hydrolase domain-containing protein [Hymenobacter sp. BT559]MBJ6142101.1 beta-lactamase family protein [Hymenobacter sp. BT559]